MPHDHAVASLAQTLKRVGNKLKASMDSGPAAYGGDCVLTRRGNGSFRVLTEQAGFDFWRL